MLTPSLRKLPGAIAPVIMAAGFLAACPANESDKSAVADAAVAVVVDGGIDAGRSDGGPLDGGTPDAQVHADGGALDAGTTDANAATDAASPQPQRVCTTGSCHQDCHITGVVLEDGGFCECKNASSPDASVPCALPEICQGSARPHLCALQAVRYGRYGKVSWAQQVPDVGGTTVVIESFGDGTFRTREFVLDEFACCGTRSASEQKFYQPTAVLPNATDPGWMMCVLQVQETTAMATGADQAPPPCLRHEFLGGACLNPLAACPAAPDGGALGCVMANDGVCDEPATGTGLCNAGQDAVDCACPTDAMFQCDEAGHTPNGCPPGSDVDWLICENGL